MNYPLWRIPAPGLLIAAVAIVHVFISHFAVGGGLFLVVAEKKARRDSDQALLGFVRRLSKAFILLTLVLGALTGVGIWFTIALVQPQATSALVTTFVWFWAIEWVFFAVEIAAAMVYYYGWDRLDARQHLAVGWVYFASAWASLAVINGILSFMLTAGSWPATGSLAGAFFNPTYVPMAVARTAAAMGLAGLYALFAAAFLADAELKARIARWSVTRWIVPAAVLLAASLGWTLSAAAAAGAGVADALGATHPPARLLAAVFATTASGHPVVRGAARVAVVAPLLLVAGALALASFRARRYGRLEAGLLMVLGLAAMGGAEWVREGVRKPWVIDRHMFVNGVRVPPPKGRPLGVEDPFGVDALATAGALPTARFTLAPAAFRPGDPAYDGLPAAERAALAAEAGRELFALQCAACHTVDGHLGVRKLVQGRAVTAIQKVVESAARPVGPDGQPTAWSDPAVRLNTWLDRRMPPFAGTEAEAHAVAVYLARLGGNPQAGADEPPPSAAVDGARVFEENCSLCHGEGSDWPIAARLRGRGEAELYDVIGMLPRLQEEMPPFEGTDAERRALARHLAGLSRGPAGEVKP